ncbi:hypothetical protein [Primorskyibacter marinus]|uniref:hypothetical protein n=1 Tax=Primorskyibacter marinus TaxID=1977320 RepID=UPI000E306043|nr:hypothetical protein [Primorskyibacter marinus]
MKTLTLPVSLLCVVALAGCVDGLTGTSRTGSAPDDVAQQQRPQARPAPKPPANARTAEAFDTVSLEDRKEAAKVPSGGESRLGTTVASLGDPAQSGLWMKTPLVKAARKGRVVFPGSGKSAQVDLIPLDAAPGSGSQLSLSAMQLIEAPLTDLPKVEVYGS